MTFAPPPSRPFSIRYLEEMDGARQLGWVRIAISIALAGYFVSFFSEFSGDTNPRALWGEGATVLLLALALWFSYQERITLAASVTVASIWLEIHLGFLQGGDLGGSGATALPVLVAGTGILLGGRMAFGLAGATALTAPLVVFLGRALSGVEPVVGGEDLKSVLNLAGIILGMAALISFGLRYLGDVLAASRENENRFSELVAGNPNGILSLDAKGAIEEMNAAAEEILGIAAKDALGKGLRELPLGPVPRLDPRPPRDGLDLDPFPAEQELIRGDGTKVWVEVTRKPMARLDGTMGVMLVMRDLTRSREAENRATQLGRIVEEARNEILVFHRDTLEILMANRGARRNLGYTKEEIRGMAIFQVQPTLTPEGGKALARRLYEKNQDVVSVNAIHHRKDGSVYPVEMQFQKGVLEGVPTVVAFGVDITDRERAQEEQHLLQAQLQHAQKMEAVGLLAGGVAHDFNNLLTVIGGCGEILMEVGDQEVRDLTREIMESQERGAALTQQLLAFARREIVQPEDLKISEVLREMETLVCRILSERIKLQMELQDDVVVRADRGQLEQVVLNLAANARDAMEEGGTLFIRVQGPGEHEEGDFVSLTVRDTGHGMDARTMERVFEPFFTTKPRGKGTGLGLSTVHGIVSQNGGRLAVESQVGGGTTIRILWPSSSEDVPAEAPPSQEARPAGSPRGTILVAEDEDAARVLIRTVLEREGYRMVGTENGNEALALLKEGKETFDLLLTDIVMPGISGLELAESARDIDPDLPILFMSGYVDAHLQGPEGTPGSLNLLAKPFRPSELRKRVREILEGS